jgi:aromatic-amino-acid transaminase
MEFLIPSRRERPGDDPIFSLAAEAKKRADAGEDIVNATIGVLLHDDGRLAVMPSVVEALGQVDPALAAGYAPIPGTVVFREAVAEDLLGRYGLAGQCATVATPGGSGALRMAIDDFVEAGQQVLTTSFHWGPYRTLSDEAGRTLTTFRTLDPNGRFDVADLDRKLDVVLEAQGRALILLNTPCHNPTGYSLDREDWQAVEEVLGRHAPRGPIVVLLDVAYSYYAEEGLGIAIESLKRLSSKVLVAFAWSASKSFTQYGLRVGALITVVPDATERKRIENAMTYSCRGLWSNCNAGGLAAITRVLTEPVLRARALAERAELVEMLARRVRHWNKLASGLRYPRYDGGFFTTVFCDDAPRAAAALRERGIFLVPMAGALRVAMCAVNETEIERIVEGLRAVL